MYLCSIYVVIMVCIYVVCCTLVSEIRVSPEMLRVFQYIEVLTCVIYNCELLLSHCEDYRRRQVGECADTWYKRIQPTGKVEL